MEAKQNPDGQQTTCHDFTWHLQHLKGCLSFLNFDRPWQLVVDTALTHLTLALCVRRCSVVPYISFKYFLDAYSQLWRYPYRTYPHFTCENVPCWCQSFCGAESSARCRVAGKCTRCGVYCIYLCIYASATQQCHASVTCLILTNLLKAHYKLECW